jgi:DNA/RNA endonuclease YhcR with UshA esterase domain
MRKVSLLICLIFLLCQPLVPQAKITPAEAKNYIGQEATVCGNVASTRYASSTRGQPTFLNLDKKYSNPLFTVIIWGQNRGKFGNPDTEYLGKQICVTGRITEYRGVPEIEATTPEQIKIEK